MCGRYTLYIGSEYEDIVEIVNEAEKNMLSDSSCLMKIQTVSTGEVFPTNSAPVLIPKNNYPTPTLAVWGFPRFRSNGVLINARSETVAEKPLFRQSYYTRRCVIPSTGFFEWDKNKTKYHFQMPNSHTVYMAGLYNEFNGERRFLIVTTNANPSVAAIHSRMPVVLPKSCITDWLFEFNKADALLKQVPPALVKQAF